MRRVLRTLLCLAVVGPASAAEETTVTIPVEPPGGTVYQRVARLLPPHVGCAVMVLGSDERGEPVVFKQGFGVRRDPPVRVAPAAAIRRRDGLLTPGEREEAVALGGELRRVAEVTAGTNFRVSSFTKVFTAAAVLKLADEDTLTLDDAAAKWLPGLPSYVGAVTLRHLLTHTSGTPDYHGLLRNQSHQPGYTDLDVLRAVATARRWGFTAGSQTAYTNSGYVLLGLVVQQASGRPFHEYVRDEVLAPIGMGRSVVFIDGLNEVEERAYGHRTDPPGGANRRRLRDSLVRQIERLERLRDNAEQQDERRAAAFTNQLKQLRARFIQQFPEGPEGELNNVWHEHDQSVYSRIAGDGSLYTSLDDLQRLFEAMSQGSLPFSTRARELWLEPQTTPPPGDGFGDAAMKRSFTCGWMIDQRLGERRYSHRGATRGFRQTIQWMPDSGRAVVVLMNSVPDMQHASEREWEDVRMERLGEQILGAVLTPSELEGDRFEDTTAPIDLRAPGRVR